MFKFIKLHLKKIFDKKSNMQSTDCMEMDNKKKNMFFLYHGGLNDKYIGSYYYDKKSRNRC